MCKSPAWTCECLMNSVGVERCCNEWGNGAGENRASGKSERAASAGDRGMLRGKAAAKTDREATQGIRTAAGEVAGELRRQAFAGEGESTDEGVVGGRIPGPQRESTDLRESWRGEEPFALCDCARADRGARKKDQVRHLSAAGAGSAGREARSAVGQGNQKTGEVRRPHHRRDGVRAAKSRGDGGRVHIIGGAL